MNFLRLLYLILTVLGFFQGIIIAFGLIFKKQKNSFAKANYLLIALVIFIALENLRVSTLNSNLFLNYPFLVLGVTSTGLVFGPLLYFYQYFFLYPNKKFLKKYWIRFIPILFEISFHIPIYIKILGMSNVQEIGVFMANFQLGIVRMAIQYLSAISLLIYLTFSLRSYYTYLRSLENISSQPFSHLWLGRFIWFFTFLIIYFFGLTFIDVIFFQYQLSEAFYYPFNILLTVFIYWIGFSQWLFQSSPPPDLRNDLERKSEKVVATPTDFSKEITQISNYMEYHKPYLDAELTLKKLAEQLKISPKKLTKILNQGMEKNFFEFVNQYRIEEIKSKIDAGEDENLTLLGIAFEAGFNSKSAFNRVFKQQTGITPKQYQKKHEKLTNKKSYFLPFPLLRRFAILFLLVLNPEIKVNYKEIYNQ